MYSNSGGSDLWDIYNHTLFFKKCVFFEAQTHPQIDIRKKKPYKMFQKRAMLFKNHHTTGT